jgi:hypothetical protein
LVPSPDEERNPVIWIALFACYTLKKVVDASMRWHDVGLPVGILWG